MKNQRGYTLIEILASITLLAVAILTITYALQQSSLSTKQNNDKDSNTLVARTVMEEIKTTMKNQSLQSATLYGQTINLNELRQLSTTTIYSPSTADKKIQIDITSTSIPSSASIVTIKGTNYDINNYFRLVQVTSTNVATNKTYTLQAYVEYN